MQLLGCYLRLSSLPPSNRWFLLLPTSRQYLVIPINSSIGLHSPQHSERTLCSTLTRRLHSWRRIQRSSGFPCMLPDAFIHIASEILQHTYCHLTLSIYLRVKLRAESKIRSNDMERLGPEATLEPLTPTWNYHFRHAT